MSGIKRGPSKPPPATLAEFLEELAAKNPPPTRTQLVNAHCVKHNGHRNPDAVRDAQAVDAWWQRMLRAGYRYRSVDRRVDMTIERLRTIVRTAIRPRERRDQTGRSSARSGDSGDDGPSEPDGPAPATERRRA